MIRFDYKPLQVLGFGLQTFVRKSKTIANVRTVDERVKHVNGVFLLENTESEYKKRLRLTPGLKSIRRVNRHLKIVLGSKRVRR